MVILKITKVSSHSHHLDLNTVCSIVLTMETQLFIKIKPDELIQTNLSYGGVE